MIESHGFAGIELTNSSDSTVKENTVSGSPYGILIQARTTLENTSTSVSEVVVEENDVSGATYGIWLFAHAAESGPPFGEVAGAEAELLEPLVQENTVDESYIGILVWTYGSNAVVQDAQLIENKLLDNVRDIYDLGTDTVMLENEYD